MWLRQHLSDLREVFIPVRQIMQRLTALEESAFALESAPSPLAHGLPCVIAGNEHGNYCVPMSSIARPAAQEIVNGRVWEPETIRLICDCAGDGDVVHAGTYFGDFLPAISRATNGTVWAFEPNHENYRCAEITVRLNGLGNVSLMNCGLSDQAGTASMLVRNPDGTGMGGGSRLDAGNAELSEKVQLSRIDDIVPDSANVTVLHLDVEGHEGAALRGAAGIIVRCRPILILETVPSDDWFTALTNRLGYVRAHKVHDNTVFAPSKNVRVG